MADEYVYTLSQCDIPTERHGALQSYRDKRRLWLSWVSTDEHHAIWTVLSSMVWTDACFKILTNFALIDEENALNNQLLAEALIDGHVATQILAIRRLIDKRNADVISLPRLSKDLRRHFHLFTRENYVCFVGLPYDHEAARQSWFLENLGAGNGGGGWAPREGPQAAFPSEAAHRQFDDLAGIEPAKRSRSDRLPDSLLTVVEDWLDESGAAELAEWSHAYLAHAGGPETRRRIADLIVTANKITDAIRALGRVTEAISAWLLGAASRSNTLMPVAQFDPFGKLDKPIMQKDGEPAAFRLWDQLIDERNTYLAGVDTALIEQSKRRGPKPKRR